MQPHFASCVCVQLRNNTNTCYHTTQHPLSDVSVNIESLTTTHFPSILAELGEIVNQIGSRTRRPNLMPKQRNHQDI